jgi:uncharacterized DUF497 family protein
MNKGQESKNAINIKNHGISFKDAEAVFSDPNAIEIYDFEHSTENEDRSIVIGDIGECLVIVVVYTDRNGTVRIISARKAEHKEEVAYYDHIRKTFGRN